MKTLILSVVTLFSSTGLAAASYPVVTRSLESFPQQAQKAVGEIWAGLYADDIKSGSQTFEFNSNECRIFENYTMLILKKLIRDSALESQTNDLLFYMDCYNLSRLPLGAKLRSRTLEVNQGYMGTLGSEDELAALLAHELSHHILRHEDMLQLILPPKAKQVKSGDIFDSQEPDAATLRIYQEKQKYEDEADINSVMILANAGYSYVGAINLLNRVGRSQRNASPQHSGIGQRIRMVEEKAQALGLQASPVNPFPPEVSAAVDRYFSYPDGKETLTPRRAGSGRKKI